MIPKDNSKPVLQVEGLFASYGEVPVLHDVSFTVRQGEILVILGESGCGKSTLLRNITGLYKPVSGSVKYWDLDATNMDEEQLSQLLRRVGISFQEGALFNSMTVFDNVALPLREHTDYSEEIIRALVMIKLSLVGLSHAAFLMPSEISGGMKKRAGVARAMALDPELLFFDEPSAGLDPVTAAGLDHLILNLRSLLGITMVVITHELASIKTIADRVLMLHQGRGIFQGSLSDAKACSLPVVRRFFNRERKSYLKT